MKRVLLFIIDAPTAPRLLAKTENGRYPNYQNLKENGAWRDECTSIFPSVCAPSDDVGQNRV